MSWKTSPLVRSEILGLFDKRLTPDQRYSLHRPEDLLQKAQTLLPQKSRTFSGIFIALSESTQNFSIFEKKYQLHSSNVSQVIDPNK